MWSMTFIVNTPKGLAQYYFKLSNTMYIYMWWLEPLQTRQQQLHVFTKLGGQIIYNSEIYM